MLGCSDKVIAEAGIETNLSLNSDMVEWINPNELLCPERFYFGLKYAYAKMLIEKKTNSQIERAYKEHLRVFSGGTFSEPYQESKNTYEKYREGFIELLSDIKNNGFDINKSVVLVNEQGLTLDGSHRVGIAMSLGIDIPIVRINKPAFIGDYSFFRERGINEECLDYMVRLYCELCKSVRVLLIWPRVRRNRNDEIQIEALIKKYAPIVYKKTIKMTKKGLHNLLIECYRDKEWIGSIEDGYCGINGKLKEVWLPAGKITVYILEDKKNQIDKLKSEIRQYYNIGNSSVHGTDSLADSYRLIKILLHRQTFELFNYCTPFSDPAYVRNMRNFKKELSAKGLNIDKVMIDSSGVLNLHSIRKANDIDYLIDMEEEPYISFPNAENHEEDMMFHREGKHELLYNSDNFIVFEELKYLSLDALLRFKKNRYSNKDKKDIKKIYKKKAIIGLRKIIRSLM